MMNVIAKYWEELNDGEIKCGLCPRRCNIRENQAGICGVRRNLKGGLYATSYGKVSSIALDPIEKKPLFMFKPGKKILSIGGYGCNFRCPFCQNYSISLEYDGGLYAPRENLSPEQVLNIALETQKDGNVGVAYTYNEPFIGFEYLIDCVMMIKNSGLMNVLVTNGYINMEPLMELLPYIDAMNVDIKGDNESIYNMVGGTLDNIKNTIEIASKACHVEVTTLVIADENENDIEDIARWLSQLDPNIPYHLSRFFPRYRYADRIATPHDTMYRCESVAKRYLKNVFLGNM